MKLFISALLLTYTITICAQNVTFSNNDDFTKVYYADTVFIEADSAYVISNIRAKFLNQRLDELDSVKVLYINLANNHKKLIKEIENVSEQMAKLCSKLESDSTLINQQTTSIIQELDSSLEELRENNETLGQNNSDLRYQIDQLKKIATDLRKEIRGIWWNATTDKLVVFAGGVGAGLLITLLL